MSPIHVVTTFSPRGYEVYGKRFIDSFLLHWPRDIRLFVFTEGAAIPVTDDRVTVLDLADDRQHLGFCSRWAGPAWNHPVDPNMQSVKFCHKVFAITSDKLPDTGVRFWIDADVETKAPVTAEWLGRVMPDEKWLSYLGRNCEFRGYDGLPREPYTECGFVAYRVDNAKVRALLLDMRALYTSGDLFKLGLYRWHDSYVFDHCRRALLFRDEHCLNLSAKASGIDVWPQSILAETMKHSKGPKRKLTSYGAIA